MFAPLRRCPASLPRALSATAVMRPTLRCAAIASTRSIFPSRAIPKLSTGAFRSSVRFAATATTSNQSSQTSAAITKFRELETQGLVHPNVIRAVVNDMGLETMTEVQSATINQALQGTDLIAQAKTGTGKTIGFLLPMLQNIISKDPSLAAKQQRPSGRYERRPRRMPPDIRAIIISPTRELAEQIAVEARKLTAHTSVKVQTAVGGTGKREGSYRIKNEGCHVLVATPGRLNDILTDQYDPLPVQNLDYFILDEADRLLETGFWEEIQSISENLPDRGERDRQTIMFSATVPKDVVSLVRKTLKPGFHFVKTVRDDEEPTHQRIPQKAVFTTGFETQVPALLELCQREAELASSGDKRPFKAIIFFNSLKETKLAHNLFEEVRRNQRRSGALWQGELFIINSELSQGARQRAADRFKAAAKGLLFSTNVTARGMDFPNVTHVIQMGISRDTADYIHRIGRTGRAGKEGEAWLILPEFDTPTLRMKLGHLPIKRDNSLTTAQVDLNALHDAPEHTARIIKEVQDGFKEIAPEDLEEAYPSMMSANGSIKNKGLLISSMETMATRLWGLETAPPVPRSVAMGLRANKTGSGSKRSSGGGHRTEFSGHRSDFSGHRSDFSGRRTEFSRGPKSGMNFERRDHHDKFRSGGYDNRGAGRSSGRGRVHDRSNNKRQERTKPSDGWHQRGRQSSYNRNIL